MEDRAEKQSSETSGTLSKLDWSKPETLRARTSFEGRGVPGHAAGLAILAEASGGPALPLLAASRSGSLGRHPVALRWASDQPHNN